MHRVLVYLLGPDTSPGDAFLALLDVALVGFLCYRVLRLIRGTRAVAVLLGLLLVGVGYLGAQWAGLETLTWLLGHFLTYSFFFGVIVLFQADIRRALAELGRSSRLLALLARDDRAAILGQVEPVVQAASALAARHHGALVVIERTADLTEVVESGLRLDAALSPELLLALFQPQGPLHDGAAVVRAGRVRAAGCVLPLSSAVPHGLGTRHRAALGLCEELDAAVVVVSEERGEIQRGAGRGAAPAPGSGRAARAAARGAGPSGHGGAGRASPGGAPCRGLTWPCAPSPWPRRWRWWWWSTARSGPP
ncbi:MAG: diadenylate cyclase [Anaeromyxobacter sp.]